MANNLGMVQSYMNTVPDKRMVTDRILMIEPSEIKTWMALGQDISKFNFVNREGKKLEWLEDTFTPVADSIATGAASSSTTTTFTVTTAALWQPGDIVLVESEKIQVTGMSGAVATVIRGLGATSPATHANAMATLRIGRARIDGDDADDSPSTEVTSNYNYTQIMQRTVNIARTKQHLAEYGISDPVEYQIDKYVKELMMDLNKLPYRGERVEGSASVPRNAGGFRTFITDNLTDVSSGALTRAHIDNTLTNIWTDGGEPDLIITGAHAQRKINDFYEGFVETTRSEKMGGINIKQLLHPISGTTLDVLVDRHCPANELWILSSKNIAYYPFDPFFYEDLAKTGDAVKGEVVGEYSLAVAYDKSHGLVHTFSTSA
jgi:hypothetical protein